jgi:hypothetical protein
MALAVCGKRHGTGFFLHADEAVLSISLNLAAEAII